MLHASRSGESEAIANFFKTYGVEQSCAVCLVLISQRADSELEVMFVFIGKLTDGLQIWLPNIKRINKLISPVIIRKPMVV